VPSNDIFIVILRDCPSSLLKDHYQVFLGVLIHLIVQLFGLIMQPFPFHDLPSKHPANFYKSQHEPRFVVRDSFASLKPEVHEAERTFKEVPEILK
jgi:hypothetical protein